MKAPRLCNPSGKAPHKACEGHTSRRESASIRPRGPHARAHTPKARARKRTPPNRLNTRERTQALFATFACRFGAPYPWKSAQRRSRRVGSGASSTTGSSAGFSMAAVASTNCTSDVCSFRSEVNEVGSNGGNS